MTDKLWGGRFTASAPEWVQAFGASIQVDQAMAKEDLEGSIAHVKMLGKQGIIAPDEAQQIEAGLQALMTDLEAGKLHFDVKNEDVHLNMEKLLTDKIGPVAGKLHTARSRNDQVATDFHLWLMHRLPLIFDRLKGLQTTLLDLAEKYLGVIMPGYTHLQHAQPIAYSHYLMAYFEMFQRDYERFEFSKKHIDILPLGASALAGTTFSIDREMVAKELGFSAVYANSLDAVSDRDFALEFLSNASILMMHLSRMAEELILWGSYEFNYLELSDAYTTGSSIMPQKKNADYAELIRGKTGRVYGELMGMLAVMKSLPLAYNKDMQEDKEGVFATMDTVLAALPIFDHMLVTLEIHPDKMSASLEKDYSNATELADYLAEKGLPFRQAHAVVGHLVLKAIEAQKGLGELSLADFQAANPMIEEDVYQVLDPMTAVNRRQSQGGTGLSQVKAAIAKARQELAAE